MHGCGSLRLTLVTSRHEPIEEWAEIRLREIRGGDARIQHEWVKGPVLFENLEAGPSGSYEVEVFPTTLERRRCVVTITAGETTELSIVFYGRGRHACCEPRIPDHLDESALASELRARLGGIAADGSAGRSAPAQKVVWVERGDEVLVHLDAMAVRVLDGLLLLSVDLETDQTGRTPLVVSFALGRTDDVAGLVAVTDEFPYGNGLLASRWGRALQAAMWASLLEIAHDHATERGSAPLGFAAARGALSLTAGPPLKVTRPDQ